MKQSARPGRRMNWFMTVFGTLLLLPVPLAVVESGSAGEAPGARAAPVPDHNGSMTITDFSEWSRRNLSLRQDGGVELHHVTDLGLGEFAVATGSADQGYPAIAVDSNANYIITWREVNRSCDPIYAQRFDAEDNRLGGKILVSTLQSCYIGKPAIAVDSRDNFIITWPEKRAGAYFDIYARRFYANGTPAGGDFTVTTAVDDQFSPAIAVDSRDDFIITWEDERGEDRWDDDIYARRYDSDGKSIGNEFAVSATSNDEMDPAVAVDSKNNFIITWRESSWTYDPIYAQRFDVSGKKLGDRILVSSTGNYHYDPAIAVDSKDNVIITWKNGSILSAQRLDAGGARLGNAVTVARTTGYCCSPAVAVDSKDNFIVTWSDGNITAQRFDAGGNRVGDTLDVKTSAHSKYLPVIAVDSRDDIIIAWGEAQNWNDMDVHARRFTQLLPPYTYYLSGQLGPFAVAPKGLMRWSGFSANITYGNGTATGVTFEFSADGGWKWQAVPPDGSLAGAGIAPKLYLKARFTSTDNTTTPILHGITLNYTVNHGPIVHTVSELTAWRDIPVTLTAFGDDPDGDPFTYRWTQLGGPSPAQLNDTTSSSVSFTPTSYGVYFFRVMAYDGIGYGEPALVDVTVINHPPVVFADPEIVVWKGDTVHLRASGYDPDGDPITFAWSQTAGPYLYFDYRTGEVASFTATAVGLFNFTVIANDGEFDSFARVRLVVQSRPPVPALAASSTAVVAGGTVRFDAANSTDPDGKVTMYRFFYGDGTRGEWQRTTSAEHAYPFPGFYTASLTVRDSDGTESSGGQVNITVRRGNSIPRITSVPPAGATAGNEYIYNVLAADDDGDALTYSFSGYVVGMAIDAASGRLSWTPSREQAGNWTVVVRVGDGWGGLAEQTFDIRVDAPPVPAKPKCTIRYPVNGARATGNLLVAGTAVKGTAPLQRVEVRIDGGAWVTALGREWWTLDIDTSRLAAGNHTVEARAFDGTLYSEPARAALVVVPAARPQEGETVRLEVLLVLLAAAAISASVAVGAWAGSRARLKTLPGKSLHLYRCSAVEIEVVGGPWQRPFREGAPYLEPARAGDLPPIH